MALSLDQFSRRIVESGLLSDHDLTSFLNSLPAGNRPSEAKVLAQLLINCEKLTAYQAQEIYRGAGKRLVLGNYVVLDKIGQGGMGLVLKAEHKRMKRIVAVKVLSAAALNSPDAVARFHREVEAAARLEHPHIVAAYDADESAGTHFLAMQFIEGRDLASLVQESGPLGVADAIECILQAARGLEYAHAKGVIHRDIKPANLLLDREGTVKILDMGLARLTPAAGAAKNAALTETGEIMGTIDYMAPEQALNTKHADQRSDVYSLGLSLWYLLTGRAAYEGETLMEKLMAHQSKPIPSLVEACPAVPAELDRIFRRMVAKSPADRYQTMSEVLADLGLCRESIGESSGLKRRVLSLSGQSVQPSAVTILEQGEVASIASVDPGAATLPTDGTVTAANEPAGPATTPIVRPPLVAPDWPTRAKPRPKALLIGGAAGVVIVIVTLVSLCGWFGSRPTDSNSNQGGGALQVRSDLTDLDLLSAARSTPSFKLSPGWEWKAGELSSDASVETNNQPLRSLSAGSYSVDLEFTLSEGKDTLYVVLPLGKGRNCLFAVNTFPGDAENFAGFGYVRGRSIRDLDTRLAHAPFRLGARHKVAISVNVADDRASLSAVLDGHKLEFTGPVADLSVPPEYAWPDPGVLGIGTVHSRYRVHVLRLQTPNN